MKKKVGSNNLYILLFFAFACLAAILLIWGAAGFTPYNVTLDNEPVEAFNSGWRYRADGQQEVLIDRLPAKVAAASGSVTIYNTLPDGLPAGAAINIETNHQSIVVEVDHTAVYEHGTHYEAAFGKTFGHVWNCVRIPKDSSGKLIALTISNPYGWDKVSIGAISLGSKSAIVMKLVRESIPTILFCLFVFLMGAIFFFASFGITFYRPQFKARSFLYLGLFAMVAAVWVATDAKILQFVGGNEVVGYLTSFFSFFLMPIPFLLYVKITCKELPRIFDALCILFLLNFVVCVSLHVLNIVDLIHTVMVTHVLIVFGMIAIVSGCILAYRRDRSRDMGWIFAALSLLFVSGIASIVLFYLSNGSDYSYFFRGGLLLFIVLLGVNACRRAGKVINESLAANVYKQMAYIDLMTTLANRTSFDVDLESLQQGMKAGDRVTIVLFDLNNLKKVNDAYGHSDGDRLIKDFAANLKKVFEPAGKCYRIGGDEFAVILKNKHVDFTAHVQALEERICLVNQGKEGICVEYAWGSASTVIPADGAVDMKSLFKEADAAMYANKTKMRKYSGTRREG